RVRFRRWVFTIRCGLEPADGLGTWCIGLRLDVHSAGRPTVGVEHGELWETPPIAAKISWMSQWALGPQTPSCESRRAGSITPGFEARSGDDGASLSSPRRNNEMRGMYGAEAAHRLIEWDSIALQWSGTSARGGGFQSANNQSNDDKYLI